MDVIAALSVEDRGKPVSTGGGKLQCYYLVHVPGKIHRSRKLHMAPGRENNQALF